MVDTLAVPNATGRSHGRDWHMRMHFNDPDRSQPRRQFTFHWARSTTYKMEIEFRVKPHKQVRLTRVNDDGERWPIGPWNLLDEEMLQFAIS